MFTNFDQYEFQKLQFGNPTFRESGRVLKNIFVLTSIILSLKVWGKPRTLNKFEVVTKLRKSSI